MENQNTKWESWNVQPQENNEQPQVNWGEQPQQEEISTGGEQQEQSQHSWGGQPQQEEIPTWGEQQEQQEQQEQNNGFHTPDSYTSFTFKPEDTKNLPSISPNEKEFSYLGGVDILKLKNELYFFNFNSDLLLNELQDQNLKPLGSDGLYQPQITPNSELEKLVANISELGKSKGLNLNSLLVKKIQPSESSLNIFKGKPKSNFIVFIQGNYDSGDVVLDLSSMGGPSQKLLDTTPHHLSIIPGWIPYSITKNNELIAIVGSYN